MVSSQPFKKQPHSEALTAGQIEVIKATVPVLAEHGVAITTHFYKRMLAARPDLKNFFNNAHQQTGNQPAALAAAVHAYAAHIDDLDALTAAVSRIGHKHVSLGISADQYTIVGEHLLASISEVLGDAATEPILDAWFAAYEQLANIFINYEANLYSCAVQSTGGWSGWRKFKVTRKEAESEVITSFYFEPTDSKPLPSFTPGQYISLQIFVPELGVYQPRQYSLSDSPGHTHLRISVKREDASANKPAGIVSNLLHKTLSIGSKIDISMPTGDFTLDLHSTGPVVLISGGVGQTPLQSMLRSLIEHQPHRKVTFLHSAREGRVHAMKQFVNELAASNPQVRKAIWYTHPTEQDIQGTDYDHRGRMDLISIKERILLPHADYYLCGPIDFMQAQQTTLETLNVPKDRIHSEVFGSTTS